MIEKAIREIEVLYISARKNTFGEEREREKKKRIVGDFLLLLASHNFAKNEDH